MEVIQTIFRFIKANEAVDYFEKINQSQLPDHKALDGSDCPNSRKFFFETQEGLLIRHITDWNPLKPVLILARCYEDVCGGKIFFTISPSLTWNEWVSDEMELVQPYLESSTTIRTTLLNESEVNSDS